jgi:hypothetical protein
MYFFFSCCGVSALSSSSEAATVVNKQQNDKQKKTHLLRRSATQSMVVVGAREVWGVGVTVAAFEISHVIYSTNIHVPRFSTKSRLIRLGLVTENVVQNI